MKQRFNIDQAEPMALTAFWSIIEAAREAYPNQGYHQDDGKHKTVEGLLSDELVHLSTKEVGEFFLQARDLVRDGVAALTEVFFQFETDSRYESLAYACENLECHELENQNKIIAWLIYQGRPVYETVVENATSAVCLLAVLRCGVYYDTRTPAEAANNLYTVRTGQSLVADQDFL